MLPRLARWAGTGVLTVAAIYGAGTGVLAAGQAAGVVLPLVTVSGSMAPALPVGSLIVDRKVPSSELRAGDVVSVHNPVTGLLTTHRIESIAPAESGLGVSGVDPVDKAEYELALRGDANDDRDATRYPVGSEVWAPAAVVPVLGGIQRTIAQPEVAVPGLLATAAVLGLVLWAGKEEKLAADPGRRTTDQEVYHA